MYRKDLQQAARSGSSHEKLLAKSLRVCRHEALQWWLEKITQLLAINQTVPSLHQSPLVAGQIRTGAQVTTMNLSDSSLNKQQGNVDAFDQETGLYLVKLGVGGAEIKVARPHLQQIVEECRFHNLVSKAHLNGQTCTVVRFNTKKLRYVVNGSEGTMLVRPQNVILASTTSVRIDGLRSKAGQRLNGTFGTIERFDVHSDRYVVNHSTGPKKLKLANIIA